MPTIVHNADAYERGKDAAIKRNATKTRHRNWLLEDDRHEEVSQMVGWGCWWNHGDDNDFMVSLNHQINEWGTLSQNQVNAVYNGIEKKKEKQKQIAKKKKKSKHVGEVGDRIELKLYSRFCVSFETAYGLNFIEILEDEKGNTFKYCGRSLPHLDKGNWMLLKATIKEHDVYKGEKQTVLQRPKVLGYTELCWGRYMDEVKKEERELTEKEIEAINKKRKES